MIRDALKVALGALALAAALGAAPVRAGPLLSVQGTPSVLLPGGALSVKLAVDTQLSVDVVYDLWVTLDTAVFDVNGATVADLTAGGFDLLPATNASAGASPNVDVFAFVTSLSGMTDLSANVPFLALELPVRADAPGGPTSLLFQFAYGNMSPDDAEALRTPLDVTVNATATVPEPATTGLLAASLLAGLGMSRRRGSTRGA